VTDDGIVRPLLDVSRAEIIGFLRDRKETWREDASNRDQSFARNRIRGTLLPQLAREWNPQIALPGQLADLRSRKSAGGARNGPVQLGHRNSTCGSSAICREPCAKADPPGDCRSQRRRRGIGFEHVERILELIAKERGDGTYAWPG
jgi:tRNA(Ile)-lysidine synthase